MNREALEARIKTYRNDIIQLQANINAFNGAIQDCEHWLEELAKSEKETKNANPTSSPN